jgi:hypothetical protein
MQTTTPKLANITPQTGRMVNEEDEVHNVVDDYGSLKTIGIKHTAVHDGVSWTYTGASSIASAGVSYFLGRTGNITAHLLDFFVKSDSAPITVEFFELPTVTSAGTLQTTINRNRQITATSTMQVYAGASVSSNGVKLLTGKILGTHNTVSGDDFEGEWLLKKNADYIFKITNQSNQTANIVAGFNWLEAD